MRKMLVVAVREYQSAVKTKAFLITLLAMPVMMGGSIAVQVLLRDKVDTADKRVAVLDYSGVIYSAIAAAAQERNTNGIYEETAGQRKQVKPGFLVEPVAPDTDDAAHVILGLSNRVRQGELFAFVVIGPDVVDASAGSASLSGERNGAEADRAAVRYHSNSPTYDDLPRWLSMPINERIQQLRLTAAHLDPKVVGEAMKRTRVANLGLVSLDEAGNVTEAEETNRIANLVVPMGLMMLMFMVVMVGGPPLMQSVLEEKMQRIAEVLLASISPFPLMMGKLLGMVGVSLTISTVYLVGGFMAIERAGYGALFPSHVVWWFVLYVALAVLMYGSLFIAVGAAVSDLKESQSMVMPVMMVAVSPMFVWLQVVKEPTSTFSTVLSLIPPLTPTLMVLRQAVPPGVPIWQPILGALLVMLTTVGCVFVSGRVFRVGILMQGKGAKVSEMVRWIFRG
ncbi:MAG: ABC transporter permease [Phycisphaerae bacterium]